MPIFNVRAPDGSLMKISGPEDATDEELIQIAEQNYKEKPKFKDYLKDIPKAVGRGGAGLLETSAIGAAALLPEEYEQAARKGIAGIAKPVQEYLAPSSQEVGESVSSKLAAGFGSTVPFFALGPAGLAGRVGAGALGVSAGAGEARQSAERDGATAEERSKATLLGAPTGLLDILAPNIAPFKNLLVTAAARGGVEGLTEAAQKVAQNLIAKGVYKPEQEIMVGAGEEGAYGAGVGALTSLIVDMTLGRRAKTRDTGAPQPERETTTAPEQQPLATLPSAPSGFDAERAAGLRAQAEQAEQDRIAGVEAGRLAEEAAAQEAVRGMPGFAGTPDINAELVAASRADRAEEQKRLEAERRAQIKQIENTQFSTDPFQDQIMRNRALQQIAPAPETAPAAEPKAVDPLAELTQEIPELPTYKPKAPPKTVPMSEEDMEAVKTYKQDLATVEKQLTEAKKSSTDLFKLLSGKMSYQDVLEVAPEIGNKFKSRDADTAKKVTKYKQLINTKGKGRSLSSMVADGELNEYLPEDMRLGSPTFDEAESTQYIYDKMASGDTRSFDESQAMKTLEDQRATLQELINDPQRRADLNYQAQAAAAEQRGVEPLPFGDLIADAQGRGVDTDAVMERVAMQMPPDATPAQYQGEVRNQIDAEIAAKEGRPAAGEAPIVEELQQEKKKDEGYFTDPEGKKIQAQLEGKNFDQAVDWMIKNAPNKFQKLVGEKIKNMASALKREGVTLTFDVQGGNARNSSLYGARGVTTFIWNPADKGGTKVFLFLNGEPAIEGQRGFPSGMNYQTLQHEMLHVVTRSTTRFLPRNHPVIQELNSLFNTVVEKYNNDARAGKLPDVLKQYYNRINNALATPDELISWGLTDGEFQKYLDDIKVGPKQTVMSKLVQLVRELMGLPKPFETALDRLVKTTESIIDTSLEEVKDGMIKERVAFGPTKQPTTKMRQESLFSKRVQEMLRDDLMSKQAAPQRTQLGNDTMEMLSGIGRTVAEPEPGYIQKARESWDNARDNPQATREAAYGSFRKFVDSIETMAFSSDAGLNNQIRREIMNSMVGQEQKIGMLLNTSLSQTAHSDAVSNLFIMEGNIRYDTNLHKWVGVKDENNIINLSKKLDEIADKLGLNKQEVELMAHTAFEARRTQELNRFNEQIELQAAAMKAQAAQDRAAGRAVAASALNEKANNLLKKKKITTNMTPEALQTGLRLYDMHPGLKEVTKIWNGIRQNALDRMVESGLYTAEEAEMLMSAADYVPFFREDQIEEGKGPKEFLRSLAVQADKRLKGSSKPVNDIFDNMVRWTQYAINRGVRNRSGLALATTAQQMGLADRVQDVRDGENVVTVWEDGKKVYFSMQDPLFVQAFRGLESVSIPTVKFFSKFADVLRQSVVLFPLFSLAQVPQDSFAAMFTSGLKPQHALTIPVRAMKEFLQTLRGKSKAHEILKNVGAVGVRDFTSAIIRADAEIAAGLKEDKTIWGNVKRKLGNWAMAADNAVRQATYEAAKAQGLSDAEAIEKAFEIFNVRRRGSSKGLALAGQVIPFFNAYLAAQHVAYRTLTGVGTSPTEREAAFKTLAATTGSVMALSVLYAMMNGDDEDYLNKPTPTRDRLLMIPGTGVSIPLRADIFALPKVLAEHTYLLMTDNGYEDPAKFRASISALLANSFLSPTTVPQAVKPLIEVGINYDFFQDKPLVGVFQQKKDLDRQFEDSTSEFSKALAKVPVMYNFSKGQWEGLSSPIGLDHMIRGMFGSFGGLFLYATNPILAEMSGTPRPEMSIRDAAATFPNASAFITKEYEVALRKDFYALKEATDRVGATVSDLKTRSPQELADYLSDEDVRARYALTPAVNQIAQQLTNIRKAVTSISQAPEERMDEDEKQRQIQQLREAELRLLKGVNLKALRERANI